MKRIAPLMLTLGLMAACVPQEPDTTADPGQVCGAAGFQGLIGQPEAALSGLTLRQETRIIRPGMAVTMDFREDRLNIEIDADKRISRIFCG